MSLPGPLQLLRPRCPRLDERRRVIVPLQPDTVQFFDGALRCCLVDEVTSSPSLLDHRGLPLLPRRQHFLLIPADLRLHDLQLRADEQPHLPSELVGEQRGSRFAAVLVEAKQITQLDGRAVPVRALEDLEGIGAGS